jgi:intraflagellar transport protein 80
MRLKLGGNSGGRVHKDFCTAVAWSGSELLSASDDQTVHKWDMRGESTGRVASLEAFVTDMAVLPGREAEVVALGCTDGGFKLLTKSGRIEKAVEKAHTGACITVRWNYEGTALATGGEDGEVKVWSRAGMLRSSLVKSGEPIYGLAWGPDNDAVLYATGRTLSIKPLQSSNRSASWKAGDALVLKVDWNPVSGLIVSGGEDCRYKVWDAYGRLLFSSAPLESAVTALGWSPSGDLLAVGAFNTLHLCDRTGWAYSKAKPGCGGVLALAWTGDSTMLAAGGGDGSVVFGQLVDVELEHGRLLVRLDESNRISVHDALNETSEELLDFRDRVIKMSLGYDHLVVTTASQCLIYNTTNWTSPDRFDLTSTPHLLLQAPACFLIADAGGLRVFSYEGRQLSAPKLAGLQPEFLNRSCLTLSNDVLALVDRTDGRTVRLFETASGRPLGDPLAHHLEVVEVALNQGGGLPDRRLALIDRNRDLYITPAAGAGGGVGPMKLGAMVDSARWHDASDMLAAMADGRLTTWYYPEAVFTDAELLPATRTARELPEVGRLASVESFTGNWVVLRRSDGARATIAVPPHPLLLYRHTAAGEWDKAIRLCRFVKDRPLWGCLAAMALNGSELNTAEVAYSALDEVDKLQYVLYIKDIPTEEGRAAELALFKRQPQLAERILLQAGLHYRAIQMAINLFQWEHALELAVAHKTHVDTVLHFRAKYLGAAGQPERSKRFLQYAEQVSVSEASVLAKIQHELENEAARPGARRYVGA